MEKVRELNEAWKRLHEACGMINAQEELISKIQEATSDILEKTLQNGHRVVIRPFGETARWLWDNFASVHEYDMICVDKKEYPEYKGLKIVNSLETWDNVVVVNISFKFRQEINEELEKDNIAHIDMFAEYEKRGIYLKTIPSLYIKTTHAIPNYYWSVFEENKPKSKNKLLSDNQTNDLMYLLASLVEGYDFVLLEKYCKTYEYIPRVKKILDCYKELYKVMQEAIELRKEKGDIWLYWIDAVPYKWRNKLPYINSLAEKSLSFENAYTTAPFTHQTFRAMFGRMLSLDNFEQSMKVMDSKTELISYLEKKGYCVKQIGHDGVKIFSCEEKYLHNMNRHVSCNHIYWNAFTDMLKSEKPVFYIVHSIVETHPPMLSADLKKFNYLLNSENYEKQRDKSYKYIDERVEYWNVLLDGQYQILMSDHGEHISIVPDRYWSQRKLHAWCMVIGGGASTVREQRLFSYLKFTDLIKYLLKDGEYTSIFSDCIYFQDTDFWDEMSIRNSVKNGYGDYLLAYRGAFDGKYKWVINGKGKEFFYKVEQDKDIPIAPEVNIAKYHCLKKNVGDYFPIVDTEPRFQYRNLLYEK